MLWESAEASDALTERFGFADLDAAETWIAESLRAAWGITVHACTRAVISDNNVIAWVKTEQGPLVMKWSRAKDRFEALESSTHLLHLLGQHGAPVAAPLPAVDGRVRLVLDGPCGPLSAAVLPELDGDWLNVEDLEAVRSAGAALATVHRSLAAAQGQSAPSPSQPPDLAARITGWLTDHDRGRAPASSRQLQELQELQELLTAAPLLDAPPQLVHHDFRAANILTRESAVVGVLDFDEVSVSYRVDDLARASVYLATRFTDWGPPRSPHGTPCARATRRRRRCPRRRRAGWRS